MNTVERSENDMKQEAKKRLLNVKDPMEKLRLQCLSRGASGIKGLGRMFQIMDDDGSRKLEFPEFKKGVSDYGLTLSDPEAKALFSSLDADGSGSLDYEEFLIALRPPMSKARIDIIQLAFKKMDKTGDGVVTVDDLKGVYNVKKHPKYLTGEMTEEQILKTFLATFEAKDHVDGKVTKEEFLNYYAGVSASIDSDIYFDLMMRNSWKL